MFHSLANIKKGGRKILESSLSATKKFDKKSFEEFLFKHTLRN